MYKLKLGINDGVSNFDYHSDREFLSSSSLKMILSDPSKFKSKIIDNEPEPPRKNTSNLDLGSYVHSLILEPHLVESEYKIFDGFRRAGKVWEAFKLANQGSTLLSKSMHIKGTECFEAFKRRKAAFDLIQGGLPEHTVCQELGKMKFKTRYDYVNIEKGYIADVKTSAWGVDQDMFVSTVEKWQYDLSAALYLAVCEKFYGKHFDFYFIAIGKQDLDCQVYKLSKATRLAGEQKMYAAIDLYHKCVESGTWENTWKKAVIDDGEYEVLEV